MAPVVRGLEAEYEGKVDFQLFDVEKDSRGNSLMAQYGAQYVPTFVFLNSDGSKADMIVGEIDQTRLREVLDALK
ncbi:MAG: thioredoxin family protein [Actinomycetota bacterium]|jgi:thioredoxin-related protein|nr:thioredoxin family protein [Actinomycetota bacterium]